MSEKETQELVDEYERQVAELKDTASELLRRINNDEYDLEYDDFDDRGDRIIVIEREL